MSLLNIAHTKEFILEQRKQLRPGWHAERVSAETFDYLEGVVRAAVETVLRAHPTCGVTVYPPARIQKGGAR